MLRNYLPINLLLLIVIALLGLKLFAVASHTVAIPVALSKNQKERKVKPIRRPEKIDNEASYSVISKLDLFRPSRSVAGKKKVRVGKAAPKDHPKLFGTVILDGYKSAILEDPVTKSTKTYSVNDSIAGYLISDILEDKVVLTRGGEPYEVKLRENKGIITPPKRTAVNRTRPKPSNVSKKKPKRPKRTTRPVRPVQPRRGRPRQ